MQYRAWHKWLAVSGVLLLLVIAFIAGRWDNQRVLENSDEFIVELENKIKSLNARNDELVKKNARLLGDSKVDRDAYQAANQALIELQQDILFQKEELVFYRGIVAAGQSNYGVNLQEFTLGKSFKDDYYHYKLVLTKSGKSNYSIKGGIELLVEGLLDGVPKSYTLKELSPKKIGKLSYSFRYFQIFEGEIVMPAMFYPESVTVRVKSKSKKVKSIEDTFNWSELMPGEV